MTIIVIVLFIGFIIWAFFWNSNEDSNGGKGKSNRNEYDHEPAHKSQTELFREAQARIEVRRLAEATAEQQRKDFLRREEAIQAERQRQAEALRREREDPEYRKKLAEGSWATYDLQHREKEEQAKQWRDEEERKQKKAEELAWQYTASRTVRQADALAEHLQQEKEHEERRKQAELKAKQIASEEALAEQQKHILAEAERLKQEEKTAKRQKEARVEQRRQAYLRQEQERQVAEKVELELCERDTEYSDAIASIYKNNAYGFSQSTIRGLSSDTRVWGELESGVAQLDTEEKLQQYTFSYGNMHRAKLNEAFESLVSNNGLYLNGQAIEIIDYGCGQGIGTVCFIDFLKSYPSFNYSVQRVRLIEPSILALKRAALHVRYSLRSANQKQVVHAINKELDEITCNDIASEDSTIKFHILSNILDVDGIKVENLYSTIAGSMDGQNYFICVSPNFFPDGSHPRNKRLISFMDNFKKIFQTKVISERTSNIGTWTRFERVFIVDFDAEVIIPEDVDIMYAVDEPNDLQF